MKAQETLDKARATAQAGYAAAIKSGASAKTADAARTKAMTSAQDQYNIAVKGTPKPVREFAKAVQGAKDTYKSWANSLAKPVLAPLSMALKLVKPVLTAITPLVRVAAGAFGTLVSELSAKINAGGLTSVVKTLLPHVRTTILDLGHATANVVAGIWGILKAFLPMSGQMTGGIVKLTARFKEWGSTLTSHSGFKSLIATWKNVWPQVKEGLGHLLAILKNIAGAMTGIATPGNSKALWQVANPLLAAAEKLSAHPALVRALLYLTLVGKGAGQIKGVFDSLKSGWNTMAGVISALTGGKIQLGMQSAGDTMLLASRNMQRAADTMVGAGAGGGAAGKAGGAAGAAGGLAGILGKLRIPSMAAAGGLIAAGIVLKVRQDLASGLQGIIRDVPKWFNFGTLGFLSQSASGWATLIVERVKAPFRSGMAWIGHFIAASWDQSRAQTVRVWGGITGFLAGSWSKLRGTAASWFGNIARTVAGWWASIRSGAALWWRNIAATISAWWGSIRSGTARSVASVAGTIAAWWRNIRAGAGTWWHSITSTISSWWTRIIFGAIGAGQNILAGLRNGIASGMRGIGGWLNRNVVQPIIGAVKHFFGVRSPSTVFAGIGSHLVGGLVKGITSSAAGMSNLVGKVFGSMPKALLHIVEKGLIGIGNLPGKALNALKGLGSGILKGAQSVFNFLFGGSSGALGGDAAANKALARRMFPWPASMFPAFDYLEMREAGYNRFARNPSSGAYGIPQALPPSKMPFAAQAGGGSHAGAQLAWMFGYIRQRYGNPVNAAAHERSANWYGYGGLFGANQLIGVGDRGPELVTFGRGGRVFSPEQSAALAGGTVSINVTVDPAVAAADRNLGRNIANHLAAHLAAGGHIYRPRGI